MATPALVETIELFFESALERGREDHLLRHATGTCRFDVVGVGSWLVHDDQGALEVDKAETSTPADCAITASEADFLAMARGEQNMMTAFLQGRVQVSGKLSLAGRFAHLFP